MDVKLLLTQNPLFGIMLSVAAYALGSWIYRKIRLPIFNPLLLALIIVCAVLLVFHIDYDDYNQGGQFVTMMLGPVTICLAVPLYDQIPLIKKHAATILVSVAIGALCSLLSIYAMCKLCGLERELMLSLLPKSVTTAIALGISEDLGGLKAITVLAVMVTGIAGSTLGPTVCGLLRIKDRVAVGLAMGTSSHAVGTAKAMEIGEDEGAMSALAISVAGMITVAAAPILVSLLFNVWSY